MSIYTYEVVSCAPVMCGATCNASEESHDEELSGVKGAQRWDAVQQCTV